MASRLQVPSVPRQGCHGAMRGCLGPREPKVWGGAGEAPRAISHSSCCLCTALLFQYPGKGCLARVSISLQRCRGLGWLVLVPSCLRMKPIFCFIKGFFPSPRTLFVENSLGLEKQPATAFVRGIGNTSVQRYLKDGVGEVTALFTQISVFRQGQSDNKTTEPNQP